MSVRPGIWPIKPYRRPQGFCGRWRCSPVRAWRSLKATRKRPRVTRKRPGLAARPRPSGNAPARCHTRSTAPTSKRRSPRSEMLWASTTSTLPGPRAPRCPPRKQSPTPGAAAANANARPLAGPRSPQPNWTSSGSSVRAWATRTSPHGFSSHHAPSKPTSLTSTPSWAWLRASNLPKRQHVTPDRWGGQAFRRGRIIGPPTTNCVLPLQFLEPLDVVGLEPAELIAPAIVGLLGDLQLAAHVGDLLALGPHAIRLG